MVDALEVRFLVHTFVVTLGFILNALTTIVVLDCGVPTLRF